MAQPSQVTLNIEDENPDSVENSNLNNALHRTDPPSRPMVANRSNLGLGDRLNSVFREIRPLVEHARMVSLFSWCDATKNLSNNDEIKLFLY